MPNAPAQRRAAQRAGRCNRLLGAGNASLVRRVRIEDYSFLTDLYFAVREAASTLVNVQDSTGSGLLCFNKPKAARDCAYSEEALASSDHHWKLPNAQRIDKIVLE